LYMTKRRIAHEEVLAALCLHYRMSHPSLMILYFLENTNNYEGWNDVVVIEKDLIMTEELTYHLLSKLYDCEEWVAYGLSKYLSGESTDEAFLKDYYSEKENVADLSLFGAKFYDLNPDKEEQKAVRETALSLFTYIKYVRKMGIPSRACFHYNATEENNQPGFLRTERILQKKTEPLAFRPYL